MLYIITMKKILFSALFLTSLLSASAQTSDKESISFTTTQSGSIMRVVPTSEAIQKYKNPKEHDETLFKILKSLKIDLDNIPENQKVTIFKRYYVLNKEALLNNGLDTIEDRTIFTKPNLTIYSDIYPNERSEASPFVKRIKLGTTENIKVVDPNFTYTMKNHDGQNAMVAYTVRIGRPTQTTTEPTDLLTLNTFPNPNNGVFNLAIHNYSSQEKPTIMVSNIEGKIIYQKEISEINSTEMLIPIELDTNLSAGQYFVIMMTAKQIETLPITIQR